MLRHVAHSSLLTSSNLACPLSLQAVLAFYDFVTLAQHRTILTMISNCFMDLHTADFALIIDCLPSLADRLRESEPRCVERVCACFVRVVLAYRNEPELLQRVVSSCALFANLQHLVSGWCVCACATAYMIFPAPACRTTDSVGGGGSLNRLYILSLGCFVRVCVSCMVRTVFVSIGSCCSPQCRLVVTAYYMIRWE